MGPGGAIRWASTRPQWQWGGKGHLGGNKWSWWLGWACPGSWHSRTHQRLGEITKREMQVISHLFSTRVTSLWKCRCQASRRNLRYHKGQVEVILIDVNTQVGKPIQFKWKRKENVRVIGITCFCCTWVHRVFHHQIRLSLTAQVVSEMLKSHLLMISPKWLGPHNTCLPCGFP